MKKNEHLKKILDSEKEDLKTLGKLFRGEKITPRINFKDLNPLKLLADNWLISIVLLCFFAGGFLLGTVSFQTVCNEAIMQVQDDCNTFYRGEDTAWMSNILNNSNNNFSVNVPINTID